MLSDGALLGAVREGDLIPWDWDSELSLLYDEVKDRGPDIVEDLRGAGFTVRKAVFRRRDWKINASRHPGYKVTLRAWYLHGDCYRRERFSLPRRFLEERCEIELRGERYQAPADLDGYLTHVYGDWRTPVRSSEISDYVSDSFYDKKGGKLRSARRLLEELLERLSPRMR